MLPQELQRIIEELYVIYTGFVLLTVLQYCKILYIEYYSYTKQLFQLVKPPSLICYSNLVLSFLEEGSIYEKYIKPLIKMKKNKRNIHISLK